MITTRQQVLLLVLLLVLAFPWVTAGLGGRAGVGPIELGLWLVLIVGIVVALFTWGRGSRGPRRR